MKPKLLFLAALVALPALAATAAGDQRATAADSAQGQAKFATVCAACHNADANSIIPANPKLAAQHPEYLVKQLQDFKSGKRANPIMRAMASMLSEAPWSFLAVRAASSEGGALEAAAAPRVTAGAPAWEAEPEVNPALPA